MASPTQTASPSGRSERVEVEQATLVLPPGIPVEQFTSFDFELEDPSERERANNGDAVHFDEFIDPSGSFSIMPTDDAAAEVWDAIKNRTISQVRLGYPNNDARDSDTIRGARFTNVSQDEIGVGEYMINGDWEGDFVE